MTMINKKAWLRMACAALILSTAGVAAVAQVDVIKTRQDAMKQNGADLKQIDDIIKANGNVADIVPIAQKLEDTAAKIPDLFPAGSDQGDTGANASIWQNFDDFKAKAANFGNQAKMLASAAQAGDMATVRAQFNEVIAACGDCHKPYRHKRS